MALAGQTGRKRVMPAASIYFHDPDGHLLEYLAMLAEAPRPDAGILQWHEWTRS